MSSGRKLAIAGLAAVAVAVVGWKYLDFASATTTGGSGEAPKSQDAPAKAQFAQKGRGGEGITVAVASVEVRDFNIVKRSIGWVESPAVVAVKPRVDSQIIEQSVKDGQMVKAGDLLFTLDDREQQAQLAKDQATLAKDQAVLNRIKQDFGRIQSLQAKGSASQQQLDQSTADLASAQATVKFDESSVALSKQKLSYTKIYAPIDGRVGAVQVATGNLVSANGSAALVTITRVIPIRVSFTLPERDLSALKTAVGDATPPEVRVFASGSKKAIAVGRLNFVDSAVDIQSGTITVKALFDNSDLALWPGQYVNVDLEMEPLRGVAVVPTVAVQPGQDGSFVYLVKPDSTIELRKVVVAATDADHVALSSGVQAGERVVVDGQIGLTAGMRVRVAEPRAAPAAAPPIASATN